MKHITKLLSLVLLLWLSSCGKNEDIIEEEPVITKKEIVNNLFKKLQTSGAEGIQLECFSIPYPFRFQTNKNIQITVNNEQDFSSTVPDSNSIIVDFVYPLTIVKDGKPSIVSDIQQLANEFASCIPGGGWTSDDFPVYLISEANGCYEIKYPVNIYNKSGTYFMANDELELADLLASTDQLFFRWPLTLEKADNSAIQADSAAELFEILFECGKLDLPNDSLKINTIGCFDIIFPISFIKNGGENVSANNADQLAQLLLKGELKEFIFPIHLNSVMTGPIDVLNATELELYLSQYCGGCGCDADILLFITGDPDFTGSCYEINYPFYIKLLNGTEYTITKADDYVEFINSSGELGILIYPVSVNLLGSGEEKTFNNVEEIVNTLLQCN